MKAVVLLSGGQDSVTCLGFALYNEYDVHAVSFNYGQRHSTELKQAHKITEMLDVPHEVFDLSILGQMADSALVSKNDSVRIKHHRLPELPASFVPNRNALFLTATHAFAQKIGAPIIIAGMCQTDYSGYPDCRRTFIDALEVALNSGSGAEIEILTPLMYLTKAQTFSLAHEVGFLSAVIEHSHTCYEGDRQTKHDWGYGCGECPACELRAKGWKEYLKMETER